MLKTCKYLFLIIFFTIFANFLLATVVAVGDSVSTDKLGNTIYQLDANDIKIGYKLLSKGDPLVLITGLSWTMEKWPEKVLSRLSSHRQIILIDNRGMGYTTSNDIEFSYELFAQDVISLLDKLNIEQADFLGFSMGSGIVQEILLDYPDRVKSAILYATSINGDDVNNALKEKIPQNPIVKRQVKATLKLDTPLDKMAEIDKPVLLIVGTDDKIVGVESSKTLATTIPAAWLVQYPKATHMLMFEQPDDFAETVLHFLELFK